MLVFGVIVTNERTVFDAEPVAPQSKHSEYALPTVSFQFEMELISQTIIKSQKRAIL